MASIESAVGTILVDTPEMGAKKVVALVKENHPELAEVANAKVVREAMKSYRDANGSPA